MPDPDTSGRFFTESYSVFIGGRGWNPSSWDSIEKGVKIKTKDGNVGVIVGAEGYTLKVFFEGTKKKENVDPEKVAYLGFSLK